MGRLSEVLQPVDGGHDVGVGEGLALERMTTVTPPSSASRPRGLGAGGPRAAAEAGGGGGRPPACCAVGRRRRRPRHRIQPRVPQPFGPAMPSTPHTAAASWWSVPSSDRGSARQPRPRPRAIAQDSGSDPKRVQAFTPAPPTRSTPRQHSPRVIGRLAHRRGRRPRDLDVTWPLAVHFEKLSLASCRARPGGSGRRPST